MPRIARIAAFLTLIIIALTQAICYFVWGDMDGGYDFRIVAVGSIIPAATCFPISMILLLQRQNLAETLMRLESANLKLESLASTDQMTGLLNRDAFLARLADAQVGTGAFLMIDVDHFKDVNDSHGHAAGDEALILIAATLMNVTRDTDIVARLGGEEFCVFAPNASLHQGEMLAERVRQQVQDLQFAPRGVTRRLTVSIGVSTKAACSDTEAAIRAADSALYRAKNRGRNRVTIARESEFDHAASSMRSKRFKTAPPVSAPQCRSRSDPRAILT